MALEPCPACARPVSQQARFCIHCRAPILRTTGADIDARLFNWDQLEKFSNTLRGAALKLTERGPSARLSLLLLIIGSLLQLFFDLSASSFHASPIKDLANAALVFGIFTFPAWLAFVLMLRRRPFGLYGALGVFLYWFLLTGYVYRRADWRVDAFTWFMTFIMILLSAWGMIVAFLEAAEGNVRARVLGFTIFFLLQLVLLFVLLIFSGS